MKSAFIYFLKDPENPNKGYIGKTSNPKTRLSKHISETRDKIYHRANWIKSLTARGLKPSFEILDEVPDIKSVWTFWEREYIRVFRAIGFDLVNGTDGGEGFESGEKNPCYGKRQSSEQIARRVAKNTGKKRTPAQCAAISTRMRGAKFSSEHCVAISVAKKGIKPSLEARAKNSASNTGEKNHFFGKTHTPEARAKIGAANSGENSGMFGKKQTAESNAKRSASHFGKKGKYNTSGFVGVHKDKKGKKWIARITLNTKRVVLGFFSKIEDAVFVRALYAAVHNSL